MAINIETLKERVFQNTLNTCEYLSGYENLKSTINVRCLVHDHVFQTKYENVRRDDRKHHICPFCKEEDNQSRNKNNRIDLKCAYCGEEFTRPLSKAENSKSGLYFCCREHKDLSQRIGSGEDFIKIRPSHYGKVTGKNYREKAFRVYEHKCAVCGWAEDKDVLEVHHIDENRDNNDLSNLIILCPICHKKLTLHKYILNGSFIEKVDV